ncbi:DUF7344 domain-containing protein (plasmid) [Haloferacaceae archaeon DSL9]
MDRSTKSSSRYQTAEDIDDLFTCFASGDRRRLLGIVHEREPTRESLTRRELAAALVSDVHERSEDRERAENLRRTLALLHHAHLPRLAHVGLIDYDPDRDSISAADHPAFRDSGLLAVMRGETGSGSDSLDALFGTLADAGRRTILDVLSHQFGPIHTDTLAREIGAKERGTSESAVSDEDVRRILVRLRHVQLPHLAEAELIKYDGKEGHVAYTGHPELRVPWMHSVLEQDFRRSLTGEADSSETGTIHGREQVVSFGQSLCDRADEELFCMFTDTNLLEAGCFTRLKDASRRGVNVYLGTREPTVREYVRKHAPEVTLWEPETNWLNLPVAGNNVGRLVLADREAVLLGTLGEKKQNGFKTERAIVGEGADNVLVVMIAQLLRPYLDRIDDENEGTESHLPF